MSSTVKTKDFQLIQKEEVGHLNFPKGDVLPNLFLKNQRKQSLVRATSAGNLDKVKFKIFFEDDQAKRVVHTTIWATTEENILLKNSVPIPIRRISKVTIA